MKKLFLILMMLAMSIPIWASEHTVTINRGEGLYQDGTGVYYCVKDGIMMTFSDGLDNENYLVERRAKTFEVRSYNYIIKKIVFHCVDNVLYGDPNFYWGPTTISLVSNFTYPGQLGNYYVTNDGYDGVWEGQTSAFMFTTSDGKPVRFGSVDITYDKLEGDIFDLVTSTSQIQEGKTYILVNRDDERVMRLKLTDDSTFPSTPIVGWMGPAETPYTKVKVDGNAILFRMDQLRDTTIGTASYYKTAWFNTLNGYIRTRTSSTGEATVGLETRSPANSYCRSYFYVAGSATLNNFLAKFNGNTNYTIRYNPSTKQFMGYRSISDASTRVWLYKLAEPFHVYTECTPANTGNITLESGVVEGTSQEHETVTFFVSPTGAYAIGDVTVTNLNTNEVTVLQPTSTSSTGNDYSFEMPAADVTVTANFVPAYEIHTVSNPTGSGSFNFTDGYVDNNGQPMSSNGQTVTFEVTPADGYTLNSVTLTDDVTGQTTTLTPNNGEYSFVMPGNSVTVTANYEEAHDLYLLGTANGKTGWEPKGPKFTFDGENQVYYIDVYFKGYNDDPNAQNGYGYFSMTKKIDEGGNWNNIAGYRLAATANQYWVADGFDHVPLSGDHPDWSFKIKAGVYRIQVNKEMTEMSITEYPLSLTFDPAGGVPGNGTVVNPNTEVTISSNLQDLVHAINPNEDPVLFYNTIDNWASQENDNTRVISNVGETTVTASAALGDYLVVNGSATYEIPGDLYLLGTANGKSAWVPYGPKFTYDAAADEYYIDVYFKGYNDDSNAEDGYGYFSLSTRIGSNDNDWGSIDGYRIFAAGHDYLVQDNENPYQNCFQTTNDQAFKIPAGVYRITVNRAKTQMTIHEYPLTLTFNPASGTTVAAGDQVNIISNLDQLVHAINPDEENATFKYATSTDGTLPTPNTEGSTVTITAVNATTTVNAQANIGYITATGNANYIVPAPPVYSITTIVTPDGAGTITAPADAVVGSMVTFTVGTNDGYHLDQVQVTYGSNLAILDHTYNPETGEYTFVMPNDEVKIYADYSESFDITTIVAPEGAGVITVPADAFAGETVNFTVTANTGYLFDGVTVTYTDGSTGTITVTDNGNGSYSFTMPDKEVTIQAEFTRLYNVVTSCDPTEGGAITLNGVNTPQTISVAPGTEVVFSVEANTGYEFIDVVLANETMQWEEQPTSLGNNQYSFVMPDHDVLITAMFAQDLYLLGTANGQTGWHTYGPKFTYDRDNEEYYVDVYFKGGNDDPNEEQDKGFFNVTTRIDMNDNWENVNPYRLGSASNPLTIYDEDIQNGVRKRLLPDHPQNVFRIKPGVFRIHVTKDKTYLYVSEYPLTVTFDPVSGSTVAQGTVASAASNLEALVHAINPNEDPAYLEVSEDNTYHWHEGNTMTITEIGRTRFHFRASIGYIVAQGVAEYFLDEPVDGFTIRTVIIPEELSSGGYIVVAPSSHTAHTGQQVTFNVGNYEGYQIEGVEVVTDPDEYLVETQTDGMGLYTFVMPHSDVIIILMLSEYEEPLVPTTLKDIEDPDNPIKNEDDVIVADELIGVWKARQYLWAKDQAQSNYFLSKDGNTIDFVRNRMKREGIDWQPRDWDQSNWVILDFGGIDDFSGWQDDPAIYQAMQAEMDRFVDNKIKPGTITGTYNCKGLSTTDWHYNGDPYATKRHHLIALSEVPDCDAEPTGLIENSLGYPGYDEDPLETKHYPGHPERYMYNHYMPYNFLTANTVSEGISASQASISHYNLNPNDRYFFMAPKDQEVAHVWAVWVGQKEFEDPIGPVTPGNDPEMMERDVFATYQYSPADDVNKYGFSGAFYVESWYYNRLYDENGAELYGKPGVDNDPSYALQVDKAYMFHIAIQYPARVESVPQAPIARAPEASNDNPGAYKVYPLDMMGSNQTITAVRELQSRDAVTIKSMTYYNMMGQASDTPFDGINVIVVTYSDGSSRSWKVLR